MSKERPLEANVVLINGLSREMALLTARIVSLAHCI
jgi:hypothetical protein